MALGREIAKGIGALIILLTAAAGILLGVVWLLAATPASVLPFLAAGSGFIASRFYESFKDSRARRYERKREAYATMLRPWRDVIALIIAGRSAGQPEVKMTPQLATQATDAAFEGILYASDDVLRRYVAFRNVGEAPPLEVLARTGELLIAMRRDLGHRFSSVDEVDIIATFINLSDEERAQFRAALQARR